MPPTRGHDLKLSLISPTSKSNEDAPHTGARLETNSSFPPRVGNMMPPTRGHDLKPNTSSTVIELNRMPPTRGHDLKQVIEHNQPIIRT